MAHDSKAYHHLHQRKRIHQKHEDYPHPDRFKRWLDKLIYVFGMLMPLMTLPQVFEIYVNKNSIGVSLVSWAAYTICAIFWSTIAW